MADEPETTQEPTPQEPAVSAADIQDLKQQVQGLTTTVAAALTRPVQAPAPPPAPSQGDSDDELFARAQQGDRRAFEIWTERRADRRVNEHMTRMRHETLIDQQLGQLSQQYPVFQDVNHPMTTAVRNKYAVMLAEGYANNKATLLAAMEKTIASNPQLVGQIYGPRNTGEQQRRAAVSGASAGHMGAAHRQVAGSRPAMRVRESSPEEMALARRMGIRDPRGAKERFLKRQESGESHLGAVANFVNEEDL